MREFLSTNNVTINAAPRIVVDSWRYGSVDEVNVVVWVDVDVIVVIISSVMVAVDV